MTRERFGFNTVLLRHGNRLEINDKVVAWRWSFFFGSASESTLGAIANAGDCWDFVPRNRGDTVRLSSRIDKTVGARSFPQTKLSGSVISSFVPHLFFARVLHDALLSARLARQLQGFINMCRPVANDRARSPSA